MTRFHIDRSPGSTADVRVKAQRDSITLTPGEASDALPVPVEVNVVDKKPTSAAVNWVKLGPSRQIELRDPDEIVVVSDDSGKRVGLFIPDSVSAEFLEVMRACPVTHEE